MINNIVVKKIQRAAFAPHKPVTIMIAFFDEQGQEQGTQLVSARLFNEDIGEGQAVNFIKEQPVLIQDFTRSSGAGF